MDKIKITFPSGVSVRATLQRDVEPELAESLWQKIATPQRGIPHVTVSTGDSFSLFFRAPYDAPKKAGTLRAPIGNHVLYYTELHAGDLLWNNLKMYCAYGPCTEPGLVGAVTARVAEGDLEPFEAACRDVWQYTYSLHRLALLRAAREAE